MTRITLIVKGHWVNGWFMRAFARPYVVIDGLEKRVGWGRPQSFDLPFGQVEVGAGIRYFDRGSLLGYSPEVLDRRDVTSRTLVFRNGVLNHQPFQVLDA